MLYVFAGALKKKRSIGPETFTFKSDSRIDSSERAMKFKNLFLMKSCILALLLGNKLLYLAVTAFLSLSL